MRVEVFKAVYVMEADDALIDKLRRTTNLWAEGDENICMTFETALEIEELEPLLRNIKDGGDVIVSA